MDSRENFIRATNIFQSHYCLNTKYEGKCVIERRTNKNKTRSLQFSIEALTKLGSIIDAYASTCD